MRQVTSSVALAVGQKPCLRRDGYPLLRPDRQINLGPILSKRLVQYEPKTGTSPRGEAVPAAARSEREQPIGGQWRCAGGRYHGTGRIRQPESDRARRPVSQAREHERILAGAEPRIGI